MENRFYNKDYIQNEKIITIICIYKKFNGSCITLTKLSHSPTFSENFEMDTCIVYYDKACTLNPFNFYRNVRRDVTAWTGWQRSHHCHPLLTRQKRCFYKGQSLTWAHIFVVHLNIRNLLGYFKRGNISLPDDISQIKIYWQVKEKF